MKTVSRKKPTLSELAQEVALLRSFMIGMVLKDPEGEYRPEFIEKVLSASKEPMTEKFINAKDFLDRLSRMEKDGL